MVESMQCFIIICMVFLNCQNTFLLQLSSVQRCQPRPIAQDLDQITVLVRDSLKY